MNGTIRGYDRKIDSRISLPIGTAKVLSVALSKNSTEQEPRIKIWTYHHPDFNRRQYLSVIKTMEKIKSLPDNFIGTVVDEFRSWHVFSSI